jgi:hypothetical protein
MARKSLVGVVADELLDRIIAGEFPPGTVVPGELELSAKHEVRHLKPCCAQPRREPRTRPPRSS